MVASDQATIKVKVEVDRTGLRRLWPRVRYTTDPDPSTVRPKRVRRWGRQGCAALKEITEDGGIVLCPQRRMPGKSLCAEHSLLLNTKGMDRFYRVDHTSATLKVCVYAYEKILGQAVNAGDISLDEVRRLDDVLVQTAGRMIDVIGLSQPYFVLEGRRSGIDRAYSEILQEHLAVQRLLGNAGWWEIGYKARLRSERAALQKVTEKLQRILKEEL